MVSALISRVIMLVFGTLYPAYRSYKAIKNKDVKEYVKWMMYWIIFALFITCETFADIFISWLPLYYEIKIVFIIWLLSPATKGSSILYRKFVHPRLLKHERAIDKYISKAQKNSYATLMDVGRKGLNVATDTLVKTAVTGQYQFIQTMKKYNSMQELRTTGDDVDAGQSKRSTWYGDKNRASDRNYNPENDVEVLQRQYRPQSREGFIREEDIFERNEIQRSQSDLNLSHDAFSSDRPKSDPIISDRVNDVDISDDVNIRDTRPASSEPVDYNYTYAASTLPRSRKQKKPIYETMPANRTSRPRRTNADKKTY
ncbi:receptor expression-enhancing protein 1-like isoform X2 [Hydractinia symbiolongicarpus]|uniref:receptor expression-enhancing protein 1-like isoform X2 n=1 Tax=Hydractinia symbiolongicarpus TaxID=13093 RepID=UPI00254D7AAB|nr:receptor expression-enhancing protein 1-like isoform X2 [Hydractinia symbiolongicarpus]